MCFSFLDPKTDVCGVWRNFHWPLLVLKFHAHVSFLSLGGRRRLMTFKVLCKCVHIFSMLIHITVKSQFLTRYMCTIDYILFKLLVSVLYSWLQYRCGQSSIVADCWLRMYSRVSMTSMSYNACLRGLMGSMSVLTLIMVLHMYAILFLCLFS